MKAVLLPSSIALALITGLVLAPTCGRAMPQGPGIRHTPLPVTDAANARNPYGNVDPRVDAGNNTGDAEVERLNQAQLDHTYRGPQYDPGAAAPGYPPPPPGYAAAPVYPPPYPSYPPPPPGYAGPPGYPPPRY
jgi:hypothetical protein